MTIAPATSILADDASYVPIASEIKSDWLALFAPYRDFYGTSSDDASLDVVWNWLCGKKPVLEGFLCFQAGRPTGLLHFREAPDPVEGRMTGFLDDLYVPPAERRGGIAGRMINQLTRIGRDRGWARIGWLTDDNNYGARSLYDRISGKTLWTTYEIELG